MEQKSRTGLIFSKKSEHEDSLQSLLDNSDPSEDESHPNDLSPRNPNSQNEKRLINMILTYGENETSYKKIIKRKNFESHLKDAGLEVEYEQDPHLNIIFVKIYLPSNLEARYAKEFGIEKLIVKFENQRLGMEEENVGCAMGIFDWMFSILESNVDQQEPSFYSQIRCNWDNQPFIKKIQAHYLSDAQRSSIVYQILLRMKYDESGRVGIENLINEEVYSACYPLHQELLQKQGIKNERTVICKFLNLFSPCLIFLYFRF